MVLAELDKITSLNPATAIWTWAVFLVTLVILSKVAWPMLLKKMEERELHISEGLRKAEEAEARARELAERQERILEDARKEAQQVLAESRQAAENQRNALLAAAQEEITAERERAKRDIGLERARAVDELRGTTVDLTLEAASRVLGRVLEDEDHQRLAQGVVDELFSSELVGEPTGPR